jgi:hypothetical protein
MQMRTGRKAPRKAAGRVRGGRGEHRATAEVQLRTDVSLSNVRRSFVEISFSSFKLSLLIFSQIGRSRQFIAVQEALADDIAQELISPPCRSPFSCVCFFFQLVSDNFFQLVSPRFSVAVGHR